MDIDAMMATMAMVMASSKAVIPEFPLFMLASSGEIQLQILCHCFTFTALSHQFQLPRFNWQIPVFIRTHKARNASGRRLWLATAAAGGNFTDITKRADWICHKTI
jgi:hypothetical protein